MVEPTPLAPYELSDADLRCVGRIVRAFASLEFVVTVYIQALAGLSRAHAAILISPSSLHHKLKIARKFAASRGTAEVAKVDLHLLQDQLQKLVTVRNVIAHGRLIGITPDGFISFKTVKHRGTSEDGVDVEVTGYRAIDIANAADATEAWARNLPAELSIEGAIAAQSITAMTPA